MNIDSKENSNHAYLGFVMHNDFDCIESPMLPIDETVAACNIETKEEVRLLTGKKIHCIKYGNKLLLSKEMYESLKRKIK